MHEVTKRLSKQVFNDLKGFYTDGSGSPNCSRVLEPWLQTPGTEVFKFTFGLPKADLCSSAVFLVVYKALAALFCWGKAM